MRVTGCSFSRSITHAQRKGKKPEEFTFLGFTHNFGKTTRGDFKVKRRTARKKFGAGLKTFDEWASKARHKQTLGEMLRCDKARVVAGHLNYYASRITQPGAATLSIVQHTFCTNDSTARASARLTTVTG
ncbi:hypothetical protein [Methylotuvimicrobium sp.]|uniref:hypothetical protein n=1 Tax=Methylotuvimicrobium sp. TaxID=2822413 RepID=UPI003D662108